MNLKSKFDQECSISKFFKKFISHSINFNHFFKAMEIVVNPQKNQPFCVTLDPKKHKPKRSK